MPKLIKAISIWQPWAQWIALGWKKIETRTHNRFACLVGQRVAIHAAQKWDKEWIEKASHYLSDVKINQTVHGADDWPRGALVCTAFVVSHDILVPGDRDLALCDCDGLYGLKLADIRTIDPIPWKGKQGIMNVPYEVIENA